MVFPTGAYFFDRRVETQDRMLTRSFPIYDLILLLTVVSGVPRGGLGCWCPKFGNFKTN